MFVSVETAYVYGNSVTTLWKTFGSTKNIYQFFFCRVMPLQETDRLDLQHLFTFGWIWENSMASAFNYRVFRWFVTPVSLSECLTWTHNIPRPHPRHVAVAMSLTMTLTWTRSRWALSSLVGSAVLNALTLLLQWQPTRNVV